MKIESVEYMKKIRLCKKNSSTGKCKKDIKAYMDNKYDKVVTQMTRGKHNGAY